ncbi:nodal homolog isoform X2 [Hemicordylus capensis]|uniref:nodal homolog isoform X2 n=1 Tax=Hemicordylus capensis TaxID=884348 RepID=UPI0023037B2E|nr:nodal homolog isoform X2 [Hemicordylus capensis]
MAGCSRERREQRAGWGCTASAPRFHWARSCFKTHSQDARPVRLPGSLRRLPAPTLVGLSEAEREPRGEGGATFWPASGDAPAARVASAPLPPRDWGRAGWRRGRQHCRLESPTAGQLVKQREALLPLARFASLHGVHQVGQEWSIIFDFSTSQQEELHLAELRLYLSRPGRKTPVHDPVSVNLFHQQEATCQKGYSCPHIVHVGSFAVSPSFPSKWIALEVTDELSMWFTNSSSADKSFQKVLTQTKWHTKNLLKRVTSHCRSIDRKAFLVLFSSFSKGKKDLSSSSLLQTVKGSKYFIQGTPKDVIPLWGTKRHRRHEELEFRHLCQRVDFYVDFDEIGWGSWIVHPKQYNAFRCEGKCPVPLEEAFQPTNHAYMQNPRTEAGLKTAVVIKAPELLTSACKSGI